MADVTKNVEIALKIVGANDKTLKTLLTAFESIQTVVKSTTESVDKLKVSLDSIKVPTGINSLVTTFKNLNGLKFSNLEPLANGFEKLKKVGVVDFSNMAAELKKIQAVGTLPNLGQIGSGFATIIKTPIDAFAGKIKLLRAGLGSLAEVGALPNLGQIGNGLKEIMSKAYNLGQLGPKITSLVNGLGRLAEIGSLPNLGQIGTGLKTIMNTNLTGFTKKIDTLEAGLKRLAVVNLTSLSGVLKNLVDIDLSKVTSQLKQTEAAIKSVGNTSRSSGLKVRTFTDKIKTVLQFRIISDVLQTLNQSIRSGISAIVSYDQALKDLQAITGATTLEVAQMGAKIIEVASSTKFSAAEVAEGMRIIGQAGFSASEAVQTMQSVSDLATGTLSTMASTVDLVTTTMRVFAIDASQSTTVVDTFANAVNKSKLTVDKLRTAMNYVGPIAKASGVNFKELSASMGTLANSGLRASTIGTGLRRIFAELVSPSNKLAVAAKKAGVALNELDPTSNGLASVLNNLKLVLADAGDSFDIFGKRGAAAALALVDNDSGFRTMLETVSMSGTAAKMASKQMEGLGVSFKNLKDRAGVLAIAIGNGGVSTAMRGLITVSKAVIVLFTKIANSTFGGFVIASTLVATSIFAISSAFTLLATKVKVLKDIQIAFMLMRAGAVSAAQGIALVATAFAPYLAAIAVLASLALAVKLVKGNTQELSEEAAKSADQYGGLSDVVSNYRMSLIGLKEGSRELKDANIALRDSLLNTKNEFVELSTEAYAVIAAIDPVTGVIEKGSVALDKYSEKLDALQYERLKDSANLANKALQDQTGWLSRLGNKFSDLGKMISLNGDELKAYRTRQAEVNEYSKLLTEGFDKSGISFKNLGDKIAAWDHTKLTSQQKEIIQGYEFINEQTSKYIEFLIKTNKIGLDDTVENLKEFANASGITGVALTTIIEKLLILKASAAEGFSNTIEKWEKDITNADESLKDYTTSFLKLNGVATKAEIIAARSIQTDQANFIKKLNIAKAERTRNISDGMSKTDAARIYYTKERKLLEDSDELKVRISENTIIQNQKMLDKLAEDLEIKLAQDALKYKGNADLIEKYRMEAERKFDAKKKVLLKGSSIIDPKELLTNTKESESILKNYYAAQQVELELALRKSGASEDTQRAEKLKLETVLAEKLVALWTDANDKISNQGYSGTSEGAKVRRKLRAAELKEVIIKASTEKAAVEKSIQLQNTAFSLGVKRRKDEHAQAMLDMTKRELEAGSSQEEINDLKADATLAFYKNEEKLANDFFQEAIGQYAYDSEEFQSRLNIKSNASIKYNQVALKRAEDIAKAEMEIEKIKVNNIIALNEKKFGGDLAELKTRTKTANAILKSAYKNDEVTLQEFYRQKSILVNDSATEEEKILIESQFATVEAFYRRKNVAEDEAEIIKLRGKMNQELVDIQNKLDLVELQRIGTLEKLKGAELTALKASAERRKALALQFSDEVDNAKIKAYDQDKDILKKQEALTSKSKRLSEKRLEALKKEGAGRTEIANQVVKNAQKEYYEGVAYAQKRLEVSLDLQNTEYDNAVALQEKLLAIKEKNIDLKNASGEYSDEDADLAKIDLKVKYYATLDAMANKHFESVNKGQSPEEYASRQKDKLKADEDYQSELGKAAQETADIKIKIEESNLKNSSTISEALYKKTVKTQREATETIESELKASYATRLIDIAKYYSKKRDLVEEDTKNRQKIISDRMDEVKKEYSDLINLTNSVVEKGTLQADLEKELIELGGKLNLINLERAQSLNALAGAEDKEVEAEQKKVDAILEQIKARERAARYDLPNATLKDKFSIEMEALDDKNKLEIEKMVEHHATLAELDDAKLLQDKERDALRIAHEKEISDFRLSQASELASGLASLAEEAYDAGIIRGEKAFKVMQALATAEAMVNTYKSATDAYADAGNPYLGAVMAAVAIARGLVNVATIKAQSPSYAFGGKIAGPDMGPRADNVSINATPGEHMIDRPTTGYYGHDVFDVIRKRVVPKNLLRSIVGLKSKTSPGIVQPSRTSYADGGKITPQPQAKQNTNTSSNQRESLNIFNLLDPSLFDKYIASASGKNNLLNFISTNSTTINRELGRA